MQLGASKPVSNLLSGKTKAPRFYQFYHVYRNLWPAARSGHETDAVRFLLPVANSTLIDQFHEALTLVGPALR